MCQPGEHIRVVSVGVSQGLSLLGPVPKFDTELPRDLQHSRADTPDSLRAVGETIRQVLNLPPLEQ